MVECPTYSNYKTHTEIALEAVATLYSVSIDISVHL
jgi:hypothetical protein